MGPRASVIDIRTDVPRCSDVIALDANICLFYGYPPQSINHADRRQETIDFYLDYLARAKDAGTSFLLFPAVVAEVATVIERKEAALAYGELTSEEFKRVRREDYALKASTSDAVKSTIDLLLQLADVPRISTDASSVRTIMSLLKAASLDAMDAFHVVAMQALKVDHIMSDDADYGGVEGVTVLSANVGLIDRARRARLLKTR